jgi:molecular chaperone DnaK
MALQFGLRKGLASASAMRVAKLLPSPPVAPFCRAPTMPALAAVNASATTKRWKASAADAGDVIGIDLGTTNSCVAIMVRLTIELRA